MPSRLLSGGLWWRLWLMALAVLAFLAARSWERYVGEYQSLPLVDWLETLPAFDQSGGVPPAARLRMQFETLVPGLVVVDRTSVDPVLFGPPGLFQRRVAGVRDGAAVTLGPPPSPTRSVGKTVKVTFTVLVFHRVERARAWTELFAAEQDIGRSVNGERQIRTRASEEGFQLWATLPSSDRRPWAVATAMGRQGPIAFAIDAAVSGIAPGASGLPAATVAEAEATAYHLSTNWIDWLRTQTFGRT